MKNQFTIFLLVSLVAAIVTYIALDNFLIAFAILAIYLLISVFLFMPILKRHEIKVRKFHECYHFINNFVISLSIKKSIGGALETTVNSMPNEFVELYQGLENMSNIERLNYLGTYFSFHVYQLFLQIVNLWEEEGGDILVMSKYLISEIRNNEEYITKADGLSAHKYVEIGILWGFCALIIVVLRFALQDFYVYIKAQILYVIAIIALFLFILFNIFLLIQKGTNIKVKGYLENEKNT